jgi:hypothetical protein
MSADGLGCVKTLCDTISHSSSRTGRVRAAISPPRRSQKRPIITASNAGNAALYNKLNFDLIRDIAPVASISRIWLKTGQYQVVRLALAGDRWKGRPNTL